LTESVVFLLDVDNTLFDYDAALGDHISEILDAVSSKAAQRYWEIFQDVVKQLRYADYLGALQHHRLEDMHDPKLLHVSSHLLDYDFAARLYPWSFEVIEYLHAQGMVVILTDGDVMFQPRKNVRSGPWDAVEGKVLICIHKEQNSAKWKGASPAQHYVMVDDKLRLLAAIRQHWRERVRTVFLRQVHYAADPAALADYPPTDLTLKRIDDLLNYGEDAIVRAAKS
jgi:hypothetical protein